MRAILRKAGIFLAVLFGMLLLTGCGYMEYELQTDAKETAITGQKADAGESADADKSTGAGKNADTDKSTGAGESADADKSTDAGESADADKSTGAGENADAGKSTDTGKNADDKAQAAQEAEIDEDGAYTSKDDVALYIHTYNRLPDNFITKKEARELGWEGGPVEPYAPGKSIGGDYFGNYEGLLPEKKGRSYTECDIDTKGKARGAKRIIFSNDGLIYYTDDHYESFTLLYGEE